MKGERNIYVDRDIMKTHLRLNIEKWKIINHQVENGYLTDPNHCSK